MKYTANSWIIDRGTDGIMIIHLFTPYGDWENLSGVTTVQTTLPGQTSNVVLPNASHFIINTAPPAMVRLTLTAAQTALLRLGERQDIEVVCNFGTSVRRYKIKAALTVIDTAVV